MNVLFAGDVMRAALFAEFLQICAPLAGGCGELRVGRLAALVCAAIIKEVNFEFVLRIVDAESREEGDLQQIRGFVVGWNHDVHGGPYGFVFREGFGLAVQRLDIDEDTEGIDDEPVELGEVEKDGAGEADRVVVGERVEGAPIEIIHREKGGDEQKDNADDLVVVEVPQDEQGKDGNNPHGQLHAGGHIRG